MNVGRYSRLSKNLNKPWWFKLVWGGACYRAVEWSMQFKSYEEAWKATTREDLEETNEWMLWLIQKTGGLSNYNHASAWHRHVLGVCPQYCVNCSYDIKWGLGAPSSKSIYRWFEAPDLNNLLVQAHHRTPDDRADEERSEEDLYALEYLE
jgi:hypothetical protein